MGTPFRLAAMMTAPRYEAVTSRTAIQNALRQLNIPLAVSGGCYYGQCMQGMMSDFLERGVDVLLTIDSDSMFHAADLRRLLWRFSERPDIDALAALQVLRGKPWTILSMDCSKLETSETHKNETVHKLPINGDPFIVDTAHFGLTLIRATRLVDLPRPWFWSRPDADGNWDHDKVDDDIWFWKRWQQYGRNVFIDPQVRIGHLEEMVTVLDERFMPKHVYASDWHKANSHELSAATNELEIPEGVNERGTNSTVERIPSRDGVSLDGGWRSEPTHCERCCP